MRRVIIMIAFCATVFSATAKNNDDTLIENLRQEVKKMPHGKERLDKILELANLSQLRPEGANDAMLMLDEAKRQKIDSLQAMALAYIVNNHSMYKDNVDSLVYWADYGMKVARKCNDWKLFFEIQYTLTNTFMYKERFEYALDEANKMLTLAKKHGNNDGMIKAYVSMALSYMGTRRWHEANQSLIGAHNLMYKSKDLPLQFTVLMQMLNYEMSVKKYCLMKNTLNEIDTVINNIIEQMPELEKIFNDHHLFVQYCHILYWSSVKDFAKVREHEKLAKRYFANLTYPNYKALLVNAQCYMMMQMGRYGEALKLNDKALEMAKTNVVKITNTLHCLQQRADILYEIKQYDKALELYKKVDFMTDSINNSISEKQVEELAKKSRLNTMKAEAEKLRGNRRLSVVIIMIVVSVLMLIILTRLFISSINLKKARINTQKALAEAEEHNHQKDNFFTNMSHAIRTPLNTVVGFSSSLAQDTTLSMDERTQFANIIRKDTELLMYIVNGVLDFSRLEAGMTKWQISEWDIIQLCHDAIIAAKSKWPNTSFNIECNTDSFVVSTDAGRIRQVIDSMLTGTVDVKEPEDEVTMYISYFDGTLSIRVENSPLLQPDQSKEALQLRHDINRMTMDYFKWKYCQNPLGIILRKELV